MGELCSRPRVVEDADPYGMVNIKIYYNIMTIL